MNRFAYLNRLNDTLVEDHVADSASKPGDDTSAPGEVIASVQTSKKGREGKRSNPDFERMAVYVHTETRRKARRKFEDETGRKCDESVLVQKLLSEYVSG